MRFTQGQPPRHWTAAVSIVEPVGWRVIAQQPDDQMLRPLQILIASFVLLVLLLAGLLSGLVLRWTHLHKATLRLVAQQAKLLKLSERRHVLARVRKEK